MVHPHLGTIDCSTLYLPQLYAGWLHFFCSGEFSLDGQISPVAAVFYTACAVDGLEISSTVSAVFSRSSFRAAMSACAMIPISCPLPSMIGILRT